LLDNLNSTLSLQIRDRVELQIAAGESTAVFTVRIQDFWDDGVVIDRPIIDQRLMPAPEGKEVTIVFQRQDATYQFKSRIVRESTLDRIPILVIAPPENYERLQRREYFRLDIELPMRFRKLRSAGGEPVADYARGKIVNLSAGGLKFVVDLQQDPEIDLHTVLQVSFSLTKTWSVAGLEVVVLKVEPDPRMAFKYTFICRFLNIPNSIQEAIIVHNIRYQQRYRVEPRGR
jgi:c-di-GMP-binding flagellar brake protein YcgR